jgi:nucleotide-binding universal stress UspA family protein
LEFAATSPLLNTLPIHILRTGRGDDNARWFLGEAVDKLAKAGRKVINHVLPGHPEVVIEQLIDQEKIRLLLMGAYGHSRIRQFIVGSTTTAIIRTARVPVLLFR